MYREFTLLNFIKMGLYFSLIGGYRFDPMVFELIAHEQRIQEQKRAAAAATEIPGDRDDADDQIREAA